MPDSVGPRGVPRERCEDMPCRVAQALLGICLTAAPGGAQVTTGTYIGDGSVGRPIDTGSLTPRVILVKGDLSRPTMIRTNTMPSGLSKSMGDDPAPVTGAIGEMDDRSFVLGDDDTVNEADTRYEWVAFEEIAGHVHVGSYTGDGASGRSITGLGFSPELLLLIPGNDAPVSVKSSAMLGATSIELHDIGSLSDRILSLDSDGFTVSNDTSVNAAGVTFHYLAVSSTVARAGSYTGTGEIGSVFLPHTPEWVLIKGTHQVDGVHRPRSLVGLSLTHAFPARNNVVGAIMSLNDQSFAIGSADVVNETLRDYYWVSLSRSNAELALKKSVDDRTPAENDLIEYTLAVICEGPDPVWDVVVSDRLPAGLTYDSHSGTAGSYDPIDGEWHLPSMASGTADTLHLYARVDTNTKGQTIANVATIVAASGVDTAPGNDVAVAEVLVSDPVTFDVGITKTVDDPFPKQGELITFTVSASNAGPETATGLVVEDVLPGGLSYVSHSVAPGTYSPWTGQWALGTLAAGESAKLTLRAVADLGTAGSTLTNVALLAAHDETDLDPTNDEDSQSITVQAPGSDAVFVELEDEGEQTVHPGDPRVNVATLRIINGTGVSRRLTRLVLTNYAEGSGTQQEMDASWDDLAIRVRGAPPDPFPGDVGEIPRGDGFVNGTVVFEGFSVQIASGDTLRVSLQGAPSLTAKDGDVLRLGVASPADVGFASSVGLSGEWPLVPEGGIDVDGMSRAQITVEPLEHVIFEAGTTDNVAFQFIVPPNGYEPDILERLDVVLSGTAEYPTDITAMAIYVDDGDGTLEPSVDAWFGELIFTGARWERTGLLLPVPAAGMRLFITVDIAEGATEGATLRLGLPSGSDVGLGMASGNDGPNDGLLQNPSTPTISAPDRIILGATDVGTGLVAPGASDVPLLHLTATNTYVDDRLMTGLVLTNATSGAEGASQLELDGEISSLVVRIDGNDDGQITDIATDPVAGNATFVNGQAVFSGVGWSLPSGTTRSLFVFADVSIGATDGDVLAVNINEPQAVSFQTPTAVVSTWPLDSRAEWLVNGMVAAQASVAELPPSILAAGETGNLAFDVTLPPNGYLQDELLGVELHNQGTATSDDFDAVRLWRDGGNGVFEAGAGDDEDLGPLTAFGAAWRSAVLSESIPSGGVRLFVSVDVSSSPTDSASVRFALPIGGVTVASGNDGPIDTPIVGSATHLLSGSLLTASLEIAESMSTLGQVVTVTMTARNVSTEDIVGVVPSALTLTGAGTLTPDTGPVPATLDLPPDGTGTFTWSFTASGLGEVRLSGSATGTGMPSDTPRASLEITSGAHQILTPVTSANLFAVENMPFAIGVGETDIVPLTLTFENDASPGASIVSISRLRIRIEDETGAGIVPADQLARVSVREGATVYAERTDLETTGAEVDLPLEPPILVRVGDPVSVGIRMDVRLAPISPTFRVAIQDSTWFEASDAVGGGEVAVSLLGSSFPIRSGLGRIVSEAERLDVAESALPDAVVGQGQSDVPLLATDLLNPSGGSASADVVVGAFDVSFVDSLEVPIPNPRAIVQRLRIISGGTSFEMIPDSTSSTTTISFTPPLTVPVDTQVPLLVTGDVDPASPAGALRVVLGPAQDFEAWDETSGDPVLVVYDSPPIAGGRIDVQLQATTLIASGVGQLPATVPLGSDDVEALSLSLSHPGGAETAAVTLTALELQLHDDSRDPLDADAVLDAVRVLVDGAPIYATGGPFGSSGTFALPLDVTIPPGDTVQLQLVLDVEANAPTIGFELVLDAEDVSAVDANLATPIDVVPMIAANFPLSSGVARLEQPADALVVGFEEHMPAVIAATGSPVHVAHVRLRNDAPAEAGDLEIERLVIRATDARHEAIDVGAGAEAIALLLDGAPVSSAAVAGDDDVARLELVPPLVVAANESVELDIEVRFRSSPSVGSFRVGFGAADVFVREPGAGFAVRIDPEPGTAFPYYTETGNFTALSLDDSYSNFPNPFAAGREETTFVFALPGGAQVTLRLLDARGNRVLTLLDSTSFPAGLHQSNRWDGRNGRGNVVRNGVYVAELVVKFDDGGEERHRRKVAVIR